MPNSPEILPTWLVKSIKLLCNKRFHEEILGDLEEWAQKLNETQDTQITNRKLFWTAFSYLRPYFIRSQRIAPSLNPSSIMLQHSFTLFLRILKRKPIFGIINILGLALGFGASILMFHYVQDELTYDSFHNKGDHIFRIVTDNKMTDSPAEGSAKSSRMIGPIAEEKYDEVTDMVRMFSRWSLQVKVNQEFDEPEIYFTESSLFSVFSFDLLEGDPKTCLDEPYTAVISESLAQKYFGTDDVIGETLTIGDSILYQITGIVSDPPKHSHISFDLLLSYTTWDAMSPPNVYDWLNYWVYTYIVLDPNVQSREFELSIRDLVTDNFGEKMEEIGIEVNLGVERFTDVYLYSKRGDQAGVTGSIETVYILSAISLLLLILAGINFINLSTARSLDRAKEVGVKKVIGAKRNTLIGQFLTESVLVSLLALGIGLVTATMMLNMFYQLSGKQVLIEDLLAVKYVAMYVGIAILLGMLAGSYPAWLLSAFRPLQVLSGLHIGQSGKQVLRKSLMVFQFAISLILVVSSLVISRQLTYMQNKSLGFDQDQVLVIDASAPPSSAMSQSYSYLKEELGKNPDVESVSASSRIPGAGRGGGIMFPEGVPEGVGREFSYFSVDEDFLHTFDIDLVIGRNFKSASQQDQENGILVNEALLGVMGWEVGESVLGKKIVAGWNGQELSIIGVYQDYHHLSPRFRIDPTLILINPSWFGYISLKIDAGDVSSVITHTEKVWKAWFPQYPFQYFFLDTFYHRQYQADQRLKRLINIFTIISIVIACIGLFGLTLYSLQSRKKEIGIRKILGASAFRLTFYILKDFIVLISISFVIGIPIAIYLMDSWLESYSHRIELSAWLFLLSGGIIFSIALISMLAQTLWASNANPVNSLRSE